MILSAREPREIERSLADALGELTREEIEALPADCRDVIVDRRTDIHTTAVALLQSDLKHRGEPDIGDLLRQIAELFASASVRLSQIEHRRTPV